ncbi:hypothetical protein FRB96_007323 [Tulasnella sp. 330]|nr:hypothetical protein FRB96_007323 [Tulasnella sp. 330]
MTTATCQEFCEIGGYVYAGTENGDECYCANSIASSASLATDNGCTTPCDGDSTSNCGGGWRLSVYGPPTGSSSSSSSQSHASTTTQSHTTTTTSSTTSIGVININSISSTRTATSTTTSTSPSPSVAWTSLGCYTDTSVRDLSAGPFDITNMTPALCQTHCLSLSSSYIFAGVEYGFQCYCGTALAVTSVKASDALCSEACAGSSTSTCGAAYMLGLYEENSAMTSTSTSMSSQISSTGASSSSRSSSMTSATSSATATSSSSVNTSSTISGMGTSSVSGTGTSTTSPSSGTGTKISSSTSTTMTSSSTSGIITSSTTSATSSTSSSSTSTAVYTRIGCFQDSYTRVLPTSPTPLVQSTSNATLITSCTASCAAISCAYAGLESKSSTGGTTCWCGDAIYMSATSGTQLADSACGGPGGTGRSFTIMVYYDAVLDIGSCGALASSGSSTVASTSITSSGQTGSATITTSGTATGTMTGSFTRSSTGLSTGTSTSTGSSTSVTPNTSSWYSTAATASNNKLVLAHFMVGNAYSYTSAQWATEINMASVNGIDAFALNMGQSPDWQPARMQDAYDAALASGTGFKMFISFDMTAIDCSTWAQTAYVTNLITRFGTHGAQLKDPNGTGAVMVSTFAGELCTWGGSGAIPGWTQAVKTGPAAFTTPITTKFVPSFFSDPASTYPGFMANFMDGAFPWNSGWPMGDYDVSWTTPDTYPLQYINEGTGQLYMAAVSPWFFTHYNASTWNKNWIYRGDDWLLVSRWEEVIANRNSVSMAEIITWNDYGESSYIGPIGLDQPNSQTWVNGFDHTAWLTLSGYYINGYKTGVLPTITADKIFAWARPHGAADSAQDPWCGQPTNAAWTQDVLWTILFSTAPGQLTLTQGSQTMTTSVTAGINKVQMPSGVTSIGITAVLTRNSQQVWTWSAPITFTHNPYWYNFNAFVFSGP